MTSILQAEPVKTIFNPFTNKNDYITKIDTNTIIPGSGVTITGSNGTVTVNATGGSVTCGSNPAGLQFTDSASCTWCTTVATAGNLVTTLLSCPTPATPNRNCIEGEPVGLLLALVCGRNVR